MAWMDEDENRCDTCTDTEACEGCKAERAADEDGAS